MRFILLTFICSSLVYQMGCCQEGGYSLDQELKLIASNLKDDVRSITLGGALKLGGGVFFEHFPSDFAVFHDLYSYQSGNPGPLYEDYQLHLKILSQLSGVVGDYSYMDKLVQISIGGKWEADAIGMFQKIVRDFSVSHINILGDVLSRYSEYKVRQFWDFYFDGPHLQHHLVDQLAGLRRCNLLSYELLNQEFKKASEKKH